MKKLKACRSLFQVTMECTICFDPIDIKTGSATLSCGHVYHFGCLARWILKSQTCPYCRYKTNTYETIQENQEESESEEENDDYESTEMSDDENLWVRIGPGRWRTVSRRLQEIPDFNSEDHAFWVFRSFFQEVENTVEEQPSSSKPLYEKLDQHIPYVDILFRHERTFDAGQDRGYDSA